MLRFDPYNFMCVTISSLHFRVCHYLIHANSMPQYRLRNPRLSYRHLFKLKVVAVQISLKTAVLEYGNTEGS